MKKYLYKIISLIVCFVLIFSSVKIPVIASNIPSTKVVTSESASSSVSLGWLYEPLGKVFYIDDISDFSSKISGSNLYCFIKTSETTFDVLPYADIFTYCLNKGIQVVLSPTYHASFINAFFSSIQSFLTSNNKIVGGLYNNGIFLGICIDDLTGCHYVDSSDSTNYSIPNDTVDNVYHFTDYYFENYYVCDYFNFMGPSKSEILANGDSSFNSYHSTGFENFYDASKLNYHIQLNNNYQYSTENGYLYVADSVSLYDNDGSTWNDFTYSYNLHTGDTLTYSNLILFNINGLYWLKSAPTNVNLYKLSSGGSLNNTYSNSSQTLHLQYNVFFSGPSTTIYRNQTILNNVSNQTYVPDYFISDSFNNYDINQDNSISNTIYVINSSVSNNSTLYNSVNNIFYDYVDNSIIDNSSLDQQIIIIINNIYPSDNGGGDDPNDPDDPTDPDDILDALLAAILKFFQALSKIIATVFTGIVEGLTIVVESAGSIIEAIPNLTDLFSSLLCWLPAPIPEVLGLGISICIIAAVFKFIRG